MRSNSEDKHSPVSGPPEPHAGTKPIANEARHQRDGIPPLRKAEASSLDAIFRPRTIAIIGASEKAGSVGEALWKNMTAQGAKVYAVNPAHDSIFGSPAFPSVGEVPEKIDLAVIATPASTIPGLVRQCREAGIDACVVLSAGFKESSASGAQLEQDMLAEAKEGTMRIIGPNCLGVMVPSTGLNATFARRMALSGSVAFLSQSGALCTAILDWSLRENVGFSAFVSTGAMADVGWSDLIHWLGDDPQTKSIVIYMESVGDARSFLSAARETALTKPVLVVKVGRHEEASHAVASHTGSLTGRDEVLDTAFKRAGVLRVDTIEELFDMSEVLAKQPRPCGPRLAMVTNAGGPGALATDMLMESGGMLAALSEETMTGLDKALPVHWSHGNPVDILGDADAGRFARAIELVMADPGVDGTLVILTPQSMTDPVAIANALSSLAKSSSKPVFASWMGAADVEEGRRVLNQAGIPTYDYPDAAARAFALMWRREENLRLLYETPAAVPDLPGYAERQKRAAQIVHSAHLEKRGLLSKVEASQILESYGIPTVPTALASSEQEAVQCAGRAGYPVVLKLHSETITHKSDVGGVKLKLNDDEAVRNAWHQIKANVGPQDFGGVIVEPMMSMSDGTELILGSSKDSQFGPVILFGSGGVMVEVMDDHSLALPPLTTKLASRMIAGTKVSKALNGVRGRAPVDVAALSELLVRFSSVVTDLPRIKEIEINPLLATPRGLIALDTRVLLHPASEADEALPRPAIRPYPCHYISRWKMPDGMSVTIRPIRPDDEPLMVAFHGTLSEHSVRNRWFGLTSLEQRTAHERLSRLCFIDYEHTIALVAEHEDDHGHRRILGVGRLIRLHRQNEAEFAIIVADPWQGQGLGSELLRRIVQVAREEKLARLRADILPGNQPMQTICRHAGFDIHSEVEPGRCLAVLDL